MSSGGANGGGQPAAAQGGAGGGSNVFQQSSDWLNQAGKGTQAAMGYNPMMVQGGGTAAGWMDKWQNPYTSQVIDASMGDLDRARQTALNGVGAQATAAGAFGGSRHGVAEGVTNTGFANQAATMASGLRNQGFNTAMQGAQMDASNNLQTQLANQQTQLAGQALKLGAANQLGGLSQTGFNMGTAINGMQAGAGAQQQQNNQQLINSIIQEWQGFTGAPGTSLGYGNTTMGALPKPTTQTTQNNPGLLDLASLAIGFM